MGETNNTNGNTTTLIGETSACWHRLAKIPHIGLFYAVFSGAFFASSSMLVKLVMTVGSMQVVFIRSLTMFTIYLAMIVYNKESIRSHPGERFALFMRSLTGFCSVGLFYTALKMIPLGDTSAIHFSSPAFVGIFACIFLHEACGVLQVITMIFTVTGVVLISKPPFIFGDIERDDEYTLTRTMGTLIAFGGCLTHALVYIAMRKLRKTSASVVIFWFSMLSMIFSAIVLIVLGEYRIPTIWQDWVVTVAIGLCGAFGQFLLTMALKVEAAGPVSLARTIDVVIAFIYQVALLHEQVEYIPLMGAVLVCFSIALIGLRKTFKCFDAIDNCCKAEKAVPERSSEKPENEAKASNGVENPNGIVIEETNSRN